MPQKSGNLKNMIWAVAILAALIALLVGFFYGAVGRWYGDKTRPVMNIGAKTETGGSDKTGAGLGTAADGKLHTLRETGDAGQSYLDSLVFLVDSAYGGLRGSPLTAAQVWATQDGSLPMDASETWRVIYPGDGSAVTPGNAAMVAKPDLLVLAIGGDGAAGISQEQFTAVYEALIASILQTSPQTRIVCGPVASVTAAYAGGGISAEKAAEINGWIRQICLDTGAVWADWSGVLTDGGYLRPEFAESDGRTLNSIGLSTLCGWLRTHASSD